MLLCCIDQSRTKLYMSYLGDNEGEAFLKSVSNSFSQRNFKTASDNIGHDDTKMTIVS